MWQRAGELADRRTERDVLDRLVEAVRVGGSRALVVHGEPGAGKTALLEYLAERASGCRVVRAAGVESEMELAFAEARHADHGRRHSGWDDAARDRLVSNIVAQLLHGVTEPVLQRAFGYLRNVDQALGEIVEKGV
jgi:predicted ATP-dependent serine protease